MAKIILAEVRPELRIKRRPGAPKGNCNALKTGLHTAEMTDLRRRIRAWHRRAAAAIAHAEEIVRQANETRTSAAQRESEAAPLVRIAP